MARATGATAPISPCARGLVLLELLDFICVSTSEVGGLLKKGGVSGPMFRSPPFQLQEQEQVSRSSISEPCSC